MLSSLTSWPAEQRPGSGQWRRPQSENGSAARPMALDESFVVGRKYGRRWACSLSRGVEQMNVTIERTG